jgi:hypothetical protein
MEITEYIPIEKFNLWLELFKSTSGRFITKPFVLFQSVRVIYTFNDSDDYKTLCSNWQRFNTPIVELKRSFSKKILKGFKKRIKNIF